MADIRQAVIAACRNFMVPIARMLLRLGISYRDFEGICRQAYVDVASKDYGVRGRPTNMSRVAVMTGLTRKEVKKLRNRPISQSESPFQALSPAAGVLHFWYNDSKYLDSSGRPLSMPFAGEAPSFEALVRAQPGDIPAGAIRTELKRVGAIQEEENGNLRPLSRFYVPNSLDKNMVLSAAQSLNNLASTLAYNIDPQRHGDPRLERTIWTTKLSSTIIPRFQRLAQDHASEFLLYLDDWVAAHEDDRGNSHAKTVGVGVYFFDSEKD